MDTQCNPRWQSHIDLPVHRLNGNISFTTNPTTITDMMKRWPWSGDKHYAPSCSEYIEEYQMIVLGNLGSAMKYDKDKASLFLLLQHDIINQVGIASIFPSTSFKNEGE